MPVKAFDLAKQRLAICFPPSLRRALARAMAEDVLSALARVRGLSSILIPTVEPEMEAVALRYGAELTCRRADLGYREAVDAAADLAHQRGHARVLVIPSDVPLVTPADIERILATGDDGPAVSLVASRDGDGTNAILCSPPRVIPFLFGPGSFDAHVAAVRNLGLQPQVHSSARLALDIDLPEDVDRLLCAHAGTRAHRVFQSGQGHRGVATAESSP
jgi:2-phospho-L-lactate guanylyltransferase